jgi:hypothetical protein
MGDISSCSLNPVLKQSKEHFCHVCLIPFVPGINFCENEELVIHRQTTTKNTR